MYAAALKRARSVLRTVCHYGATGYGKTELVRQYLSDRRYTYLFCGELPWAAGALPPKESGKRSCRVAVIETSTNLYKIKQL